MVQESRKAVFFASLETGIASKELPSLYPQPGPKQRTPK